MHRPSRQLKKFVKTFADESSFMDGQERQLEVANEIKKGVESVFGTALYMAIEELERAAYLNMAKTSPLRVFRQMEVRKELGIVQYIKARLDSYITNGEAIEENMKLILGVDDDREDAA